MSLNKSNNKENNTSNININYTYGTPKEIYNRLLTSNNNTDIREDIIALKHYLDIGYNNISDNNILLLCYLNALRINHISFNNRYIILILKLINKYNIEEVLDFMLIHKIILILNNKNIIYLIKLISNKQCNKEEFNKEECNNKEEFNKEECNKEIDNINNNYSYININQSTINNINNNSYNININQSTINTVSNNNINQSTINNTVSNNNINQSTINNINNNNPSTININNININQSTINNINNKFYIKRIFTLLLENINKKNIEIINKCIKYTNILIIEGLFSALELNNNNAKDIINNNIKYVIRNIKYLPSSLYSIIDIGRVREKEILVENISCKRYLYIYSNSGKRREKVLDKIYSITYCLCHNINKIVKDECEIINKIIEEALNDRNSRIRFIALKYINNNNIINIRDRILDTNKEVRTLAINIFLNLYNNNINNINNKEIDNNNINDNNKEIDNINDNNKEINNINNTKDNNINNNIINKEIDNNINNNNNNNNITTINNNNNINQSTTTIINNNIIIEGIKALIEGLLTINKEEYINVLNSININNNILYSIREERGIEEYYKIYNRDISIDELEDIKEYIDNYRRDRNIRDRLLFYCKYYKFIIEEYSILDIIKYDIEIALTYLINIKYTYNIINNNIKRVLIEYIYNSTDIYIIVKILSIIDNIDFYCNKDNSNYYYIKYMIEEDNKEEDIYNSIDNINTTDKGSIIYNTTDITDNNINNNNNTDITDNNIINKEINNITTINNNNNNNINNNYSYIYYLSKIYNNLKYKEQQIVLKRILEYNYNNNYELIIIISNTESMLLLEYSICRLISMKDRKYNIDRILEYLIERKNIICSVIYFILTGNIKISNIKYYILLLVNISKGIINCEDNKEEICDGRVVNNYTTHNNKLKVKEYKEYFKRLFLLYINNLDNNTKSILYTVNIMLKRKRMYDSIYKIDGSIIDIRSIDIRDRMYYYIIDNVLDNIKDIKGNINNKDNIVESIKILKDIDIEYSDLLFSIRFDKEWI